MNSAPGSGELQKEIESLPDESGRRVLLLVIVALIATSGLAYELVAGTMATYLLGQSILQFSLATGWFLAAMGLGSYLSRFVNRRIIETFLYLQMILAILGGFSAAALFLAYSLLDTLYPVFLFLAITIGSCVGMEIPILLRLVSHKRILSLAVSEVLTWDYLGALLSSLIFPLVLLPQLGLIRASLFFGLMNWVGGAVTLTLIKKENRTNPLISITVTGILIVSGFIGSTSLTTLVEDLIYQDPVIYTKTTRYQRIVVTRWRDDIRLYLEGNLQFSSRDEFRYHESIVHAPVAALGRTPETVLVLGGGDGLVLREVFKYDSVKHADLVDLDPEMIRIFQERSELRELHNGSLTNPKLKIHIYDAFQFVEEENGPEEGYDLIIIDLPDPNNHSLGRLYTVAFYNNALKRLKSDGILVTQATSPLYAKKAFRSIEATLVETCRLQSRRFRTGAGCRVVPFHAYIPSFGEWGFIMAGRQILPPEKMQLPELSFRFLNQGTLQDMFHFPEDLLLKSGEEVPINRLETQELVPLYEKSWNRWFE